MLKEHLEFVAVDEVGTWSRPDGYPEGMEEKILTGSLDHEARTGSRTRLLRFAPGVYTTAPFVHTYWEEVYLVQGDLTVGSDANGQGGTSYQPHTYACRPPGAFHGPFKSENGCVLVEMHYYVKDDAIAGQG